MDTRFAVAVHSLVLISAGEGTVTSDSIAETLNTNASYVRRILSALVKAGLITSASKTRGCAMLKDAKDVRLSDIYDVVEPNVSKLGFSIYQNPDKSVLLCEYETPVMENLFKEMEDAVTAVLESRTLQDVIDEILSKAEQK